MCVGVSFKNKQELEKAGGIVCMVKNKVARECDFQVELLADGFSDPKCFFLIQDNDFIF